MKVWPRTTTSKTCGRKKKRTTSMSLRRKISVRAAHVRGIMDGVMSLIQLIELCPDKKLPCFDLFDYPNLKVRGISDDISRGQVSTPENFRRILRFMARYKLKYLSALHRRCLPV
jgi:hypothetical protein